MVNYLTPNIVTAIRDGRQPVTLFREAILMSNVPTDWAPQRKKFGFAPSQRAFKPSDLLGRGLA